MIRIVTDGLSPRSLRVTDAETGLELKGIMKMEILFEPNHIPRAVLTVGIASMDVQADEGYVSANQADVYVGERPVVELQVEHFNYALPAGFFDATTDQVAESAQRWDRIQRLLLGCEESVAKLDAKPASAPGTSTPAGLAVDGGYKGLRG